MTSQFDTNAYIITITIVIIVIIIIIIILLCVEIWIHGFDAVGWMAGRASGQ